MSLVYTPPTSDSFLPHQLSRKRTHSFSSTSSPRPRKLPRTSPTTMVLRRSESYIVLPTAGPTSAQPRITVPYQQSLLFYKEQREREKAATRATFGLEPITIRTRLETTHSTPRYSQHSTEPASRSRSLTRTTTLLDVTSESPAQHPIPSKRRPLVRTPSLFDVTKEPSQSSHSEYTSDSIPFYVPSHLRASSPLSPKRHLLPGRPTFPRSKVEPNLHRKALIACMRISPEGQKILRMGPRLALSILTATQELEKIIAEQETGDVSVDEDWDMVL